MRSRRSPGPRVALLEYGSGAGVKIRLLLDALERPAAYVPIDISREQLARVARELAAEYPDVAVRPLNADYTLPHTVPDLPVRSRRVAFFPGSTIGNFHPMEAAVFLGRVRRVVGKDGALVLGVDRRKRAATLNAAYDDAAGVTAEFNLNILTRLNHDAGAHFDLAKFRHRAFFNSRASRVEMHLVSTEATDGEGGGRPHRFREGRVDLDGELVQVRSRAPGGARRNGRLPHEEAVDQLEEAILGGLPRSGVTLMRRCDGALDQRERAIHN